MPVSNGNGGRWLERTIAGVIVAALVAWISAVGRDLSALRIADAQMIGAMATLDARTTGDLRTLGERLGAMNATMLRIEDENRRTRR